MGLDDPSLKRSRPSVSGLNTHVLEDTNIECENREVLREIPQNGSVGRIADNDIGSGACL